jgi:hypothetical protein
LLRLGTLNSFEVGPWSNLEQSLVNVPRDKTLLVSIHPNDVLFATPAEMEAKLQRIASLCRGRNYDITTSGLTPTGDSIEQFIQKIQTWTRLARGIMERERRPSGGEARLDAPLSLP